MITETRKQARLGDPKIADVQRKDRRTKESGGRLGEREEGMVTQRAEHRHESWRRKSDQKFRKLERLDRKGADEVTANRKK
jgi:hypothetical protein